MSSAPPPPCLNDAVQTSLESWQRDLQSLFDHAKDRFADVVWELVGEDDSAMDQSEEVWGHKAIVYARAPPSFQARYFSFRPAPAASPMPAAYYSPNGQSAVSLNGDIMSYSPVRSPSPLGTMRTQSPAPSTTYGPVLRLHTSIASSLFSNELEYLYTGKGLGEAFNFLFESHDKRESGDIDDQRVDKLRKDLVFMWRSRLYSDVRLSITGIFASSSVPDGETQSAQFSSHRFILASRSPYFRTQLLGPFATPNPEPGQPLTLHLPSPPFTPASLHFILGYIYTGTVAFSNRTFDLDTSFHILRSALYLSLTSLYDEVQARIVQEMMHGLFHAFLDFSEYENVTGGRWGVGGCKCKTCARRIPRILEFALADDVKNIYLERGARRALVGHFGEGWCTSEFASLPLKLREQTIKGVQKRAEPMNIFPLILAAHQGLAKLDRLQGGPSDELWSNVSRDAIITGLKHVADSLCANCAAFFEQPDWIAILEADGARFEDVEHTEWVMDAVRRGLSEKNGGMIYQVLVSSILIRPHPTESGDTMLSAQSRIRALVEKAREDVIRWLRRQWMAVRQQGGFDDLESWALKEISHEIEVPVEDLRSAPSVQVNGTIKSNVVRGPSRGVPMDDTSSVSSMRSSLLNRSAARTQSNAVPSAPRARNISSANSVRSVSTASTTSTVSRSLRTNPPNTGVAAPTVATTSRANATPSPNTKQVKPPTPSTRSSRASSVSTLTRTRQASTKQAEAKQTKETPKSSPQGQTTLSRSGTLASTRSEASTAFKTAKSEVSSNLTVPRLRKSSGASNASVKSSASASPNRVVRSRRGSDASMKSTASSVSPNKLHKASPKAAATPTIVPPRPKSTASVRSARSTTSVKTAKGTPSSEPPPPVPIKDSKYFPPTPSAEKGKEKAVVSPLLRTKHSTVPSESDGGSTIRGSIITKKMSSDTITAKPHPAPQGTLPQQAFPRGAVLNVGIPCIVSSKRARFRALARYIGEVEGEVGPWVGLEVPMNDTWGSDKLEGRQWNDGSWGGVRYFDIHPGSDWDEVEERTARRRRLDQISSMMLNGENKGKKREGEQLAMERAKRMRSVSPPISDMSVTDTRGLFVRPQQVLYVVDAVGSDL